MLTFNKYINEFEYIFILVLLIVPFFWQLFKEVLFQNKGRLYKETLIPIQASLYLKGICCIIIPIHHYAIFFCETPFVNIIRLGAGNVALVVFFFLSAYGVLISERKKNLSLFTFFKRRILRIYTPFAVITTLAVLVALLVGADEISKYPTNMSDDIVRIAHEKTIQNLFFMSIGAIEIDSSMWFVWVTLVGYVIFFICKSFFNVDNHKKPFLILYIVLVLVFGLFCHVIDTPIHYYRNLWVLVLGTFVALYEKELLENSAKLGLSVILTIIYIWSQVFLLKEMTYFIHASLGLALLFMFCLYTQYCNACKQKWLLSISGISYYVYLLHEKIFVFVNHYIGKTNIIPPLLIILLFAYLYMRLTRIISFIK